MNIMTDPAHSHEMPLSSVYGSCVKLPVQVYSCSVTYPKVRGNVSCDGTSCGVTHIRRLEPDAFPRALPFRLSEYTALLNLKPVSLGYPDTGTISAVDQYMLGSDAPMALPSADGYVAGFESIPGSVFAQRLTAVLNTAWQAGMCPFGNSLGAPVEFDDVEPSQLVKSRSANITAYTTKIMK